MSDRRILEKLEKVNSEKREIILKMDYKGKTIHSKIIEIPDYIQEIIDDDELNFYYFFKDMANKLEEKINEAHKKKVWGDLNKENKNGEDNTEQS
jgi:hypothetical protein